MHTGETAVQHLQNLYATFQRRHKEREVNAALQTLATLEEAIDEVYSVYCMLYYCILYVVLYIVLFVNAALQTLATL